MSKHEESNAISIGSCPTCGGLAQFIEGGMVRHVDLRATIEAETEARVLAGATAWTDSDLPLPEDEQIEAAHPIKSGRHDTYNEAMRLIGAKRSKYALVDLVNWLLVRLSTKNLPTSPTANEKLSSAKLADGWRLVPVGVIERALLLAEVYQGRAIDADRVRKELTAVLQASPDTDLSVSGEVIGGCPRCGQKHDDSVDDIEPIL